MELWGKYYTDKFFINIYLVLEQLTKSAKTVTATQRRTTSFSRILLYSIIILNDDCCSTIEDWNSPSTFQLNSHSNSPSSFQLNSQSSCQQNSLKTLIYWLAELRERELNCNAHIYNGRWGGGVEEWRVGYPRESSGNPPGIQGGLT